MNKRIFPSKQCTVHARSMIMSYIDASGEGMNPCLITLSLI